MARRWQLRSRVANTTLKSKVNVKNIWIFNTRDGVCYAPFLHHPQSKDHTDPILFFFFFGRNDMHIDINIKDPSLMLTN